MAEHLRLSELTTEIHRTLLQGLGQQTFWVLADVTSHTYRPERRNHYFELVEKDPATGNIIAKILGRAWGKGTDAIEAFEEQTGQRFTSNIAVLVSVKVAYHNVYGLQVHLLAIDSNFTLGALEQKRRETLAQLISQNPGLIDLVDGKYYTRNNQLKLPAHYSADCSHRLNNFSGRGGSATHVATQSARVCIPD